MIVISWKQLPALLLAGSVGLESLAEAGPIMEVVYNVLLWPPSVYPKPALNLSCSAHSLHVSSQLYSWHRIIPGIVSEFHQQVLDCGIFRSLHVALECDMGLHSGTFRLSVVSLWWQWKYEMKLLLSCSHAITQLFSILCELLKL